MSIIAAISRKHFMWRQHIAAATLALAAGAIVSILIAKDRAPPLVLMEPEIIPNPARAGQRITVRWLDEWTRRCEGELSREISGSDKVIKSYRKKMLRVPVYLGMQTSDSDFFVPKNMAAGEVVYDGVIMFRDCGLTSRWWPIVVKVPPVTFSVIP